MRNKIIRICVILMLMVTLCINTSYVLAEEDSGILPTENEPEPTPDEPITTPDEPVTTPDEPVTTPDEPVTTPDEPISTPDEPISTPDEPITTPDEPITTPDEPITTPDEPEQQPTSDTTIQTDKPLETHGTTSTARPQTTQTPKTSNKPNPTEDVTENDSDDSKTEDDENEIQSSVSGNIILNTVVKSVAEKEDFSGKGVSLIEIKGINGDGKKTDYELTPKFNINTYDYKCRVDLDIENIEINMQLIDEEWTSEVIGNNKIVKGENLITIISSNEDKSENVTYQINIIKAEEVIETTPQVNGNVDNQTPKKSAAKDIILIVCVVIIVISLLTIVITKILKYREQEKNRRDDKDEM